MTAELCGTSSGRLVSLRQLHGQGQRQVGLTQQPLMLYAAHQSVSQHFFQDTSRKLTGLSQFPQPCQKCASRLVQAGTLNSSY